MGLTLCGVLGSATGKGAAGDSTPAIVRHRAPARSPATVGSLGGVADELEGSGDRPGDSGGSFAADVGANDEPDRRTWWRQGRSAFVAIAIVVAFAAGVLVGVNAGGPGGSDVELRAAQGDFDLATDDDGLTDAVEDAVDDAVDGALEPPPPAPVPVPPPQEPVAPPPPLSREPAMREVLRDPKGQWSLWRSTTSSCVELRVNTVRHRDLLCNAARPLGPVGEGHVVATDIGRLFVGLTDGTPDGALSMPPGTSGLGPDAEDPGRGYAVLGVPDGRPGDVILTESDAPVAHVTVPAVDGPVSRERLQPRTGAPYERLTNYARVTYTGLWYGGHEIVGFYDGSDGRRCVRWGRYGGSDERILADSCAAGPDGEGAIVYAAVVRDSAQRPGYRAIAVATRPASTVECSRDACSGGHVSGGSAHPDPSGSGLVVAAGPFASTLDLSPDDVITVIARDASGAQVDRRDVTPSS